jgi:NAD(P)-dependent dehydrogenase (short-subunit alcohol dehydrogenase family)
MDRGYVAVSGAAGGIGSATCQLLSASGYHVFAMDLKPVNTTLFRDLNYTWMQVDISDQKSVLDALNRIRAKTAGLEGLINIAGIFDQFALAEVASDRFEELIKTNFIGHQYLTNSLFPLLHKSRGRVINLSSETILAPMPLQAYAFSKRLFEIWNEQLRMEFNLLGMSVIIVRAGGHLTPFISNSMENISTIDRRSLFRSIAAKGGEVGVGILKKVKRDPIEVARVLVHALTVKKPQKVYHVNVSLLFKMLSVIPVQIREMIIGTRLRKWQSN